ncbi:MAG: hypothetical protein DRO11_04940 [Methanobacteriota archaeon]|nr:MAG: hypothetical protein DRO11_04940 [Euryarchaeota archaeon]
MFLKAYRRDDRVSSRLYVHPIYEELLKNGDEIEDWFVDTADLEPEDHFEIQAAVQKYTDGAVSKTINMPEGTTPEELSKLTLEYIRDLKGVTAYVDGSREGQILNRIPEGEVREYLEQNDSASPEAIECATGACDI